MRGSPPASRYLQVGIRRLGQLRHEVRRRLRLRTHRSCLAPVAGTGSRRAGSRQLGHCFGETLPGDSAIRRLGLARSKPGPASRRLSERLRWLRHRCGRRLRLQLIRKLPARASLAGHRAPQSGRERLCGSPPATARETPPLAESSQLRASLRVPTRFATEMLPPLRERRSACISSGMLSLLRNRYQAEPEALRQQVRQEFPLYRCLDQRSRFGSRIEHTASSCSTTEGGGASAKWASGSGGGYLPTETMENKVDSILSSATHKLRVARGAFLHRWRDFPATLRTDPVEHESNVHASLSVTCQLHTPYGGARGNLREDRDSISGQP